MTRQKTRDILPYLRPMECAEVLSELLRRHPDLRAEASALAKDLLDDVPVEAVAEEVADRVRGIGLEELNSRAGKHSWGYVEPSEAAWELLEESIEDVQTDMKRRREAGMESAAKKVCQGIVLGLHSVRNTNSDGALGWAPDFPAEAATHTVLTFVELYPQNRRQAVGRRILAGVEGHAEDWMDMLQRVVDGAASAKRRGAR